MIVLQTLKFYFKFLCSYCDNEVTHMHITLKGKRHIYFCFHKLRHKENKWPVLISHVET